MKRMVKNGDLLDVEPDGTITVAGKPVGGGGSDYTAGSNIEIGENKEISLKSDITGINSFKFAGNSSPDIGVINGSNLKIKSNSSSFDFPNFFLYRYGYEESANRSIKLVFRADNTPGVGMFFDSRDFGDLSYVFLTKGGKVPPVPSADGTYVLKATKSAGKITYSWVAE